MRKLHRGILASMSSIKIPELEQASKLCLMGKYRAAQGYFERTVQISRNARMDANLEDEGGKVHVEAVAKLAACQFLNGKAGQLGKLLRSVRNKNLNPDYHKYLEFLYWSNELNSESRSQEEQSETSQGSDKKEIARQLKAIVETFVNKKSAQSKNQMAVKHFPVLKRVADSLNNGTDYRKQLISLVERSPKSQKSQNPKEEIKSIVELGVSSQLQLLHHLSTLFTHRSLTTADKQLINTRVNQILKQYEGNRPQEVYKPLLNIIMSLVGEKHYMSAEGMIGFLKTQQLKLIQEGSSQDRKLINNIYRMLVTRANNEAFEVGWAKEDPVKLGTLAMERLIRAPLLGQSLHKLLC